MTRILYAVSPIGLGHASRAVAIGLKLSETGLRVEFATGGRAAAFLRSYDFVVHDVVTEPIPSEKGGVMRYPGIWYIRYWSGYRSTRTRMSELATRIRPDLIVGDEEFSSLSIAIERGIEQVMISDELELGFAKSAFSKYIERRVSKWYDHLQSSVSSILVPDFGSDRGNIHYMSPVVRTATAGREQLLRSIGVPTSSRVILLSASGSGIGEFLLRSAVTALEELGEKDLNLVVTGLERRTEAHPNVLYLGLYRDNQNLVASSDLVLSTAGKSTIDEALSFGTPVIAIPIKNHIEQERNAAALGFVHEDLLRLRELISRRIGKRGEPKNYQGAERISRYLSSLV